MFGGVNMRVKISQSKNSTSYSIIKDIMKNGKKTTKIVETLGNYDEIKAKYPDQEPLEWAKAYAKKLTKEEKEGKTRIISVFDRSKLIEYQHRPLKEITYLYVQNILSLLKLDNFLEKIEAKSHLSFSLFDVLTILVTNRMVEPTSKRSAYAQAQSYLEPPAFQQHHIYRALEHLAAYSEALQSHIYKESAMHVERNNHILYYDCTNFFFEIEEEDGKRKYGKSKENRPNPIIQMGLFMDGSGFPLAFSLFGGNENEQPSLQPLEKRILKDFKLSKFVVCTDAGLSSTNNRRFNSIKNRAFITTQSLKKLKKVEKDWALSPLGWKTFSSNKTYNLNEIDDLENDTRIYYKERWYKQDPTPEEKKKGVQPLEQKMIVTYSPKYDRYQKEIRNKQIDRAIKKMGQKDPAKNSNPNSPARFIQQVNITQNGEVADESVYTLNEKKIVEEAKYDGFYCVCTNLEGDTEKIVAINHQRWEIEESFRIMKTEFKARPVYLHRETRIEAHFLVCFIALLVYRIVSQLLGDQYTCSEILQCLEEMRWFEIQGEGYIPAYQRTPLTDQLHSIFPFRTDYQFIGDKEFNKIKKLSASGKINK